MPCSKERLLLLFEDIAFFLKDLALFIFQWTVNRFRFLRLIIFFLFLIILFFLFLFLLFVFGKYVLNCCHLFLSFNFFLWLFYFSIVLSFIFLLFFIIFFFCKKSILLVGLKGERTLGLVVRWLIILLLTTTLRWRHAKRHYRRTGIIRYNATLMLLEARNIWTFTDSSSFVSFGCSRY